MTPVLVIDDEQAVRNLMVEILSRAGYHPIGAGSAREALALLDTPELSLVVSDIVMPGLSGFELLDEVRARRPSLPVLLVTGSGTEDNLQEALAHGAAGLLVKPFSQAELRQRVADLVETIESEAAAALAASGRVPMGVAGVLRQSPETRPAQSKRSPAPLYHAATRAVRKAFREAYATFVAAFREASERLSAGDRMARFPIGSFPPGLPFVVAEAIGPP